MFKLKDWQLTRWNRLLGKINAITLLYLFIFITIYHQLCNRIMHVFKNQVLFLFHSFIQKPFLTLNVLRCVVIPQRKTFKKLQTQMVYILHYVQGLSKLLIHYLAAWILRYPKGKHKTKVITLKPNAFKLQVVLNYCFSCLRIGKY